MSTQPTQLAAYTLSLLLGRSNVITAHRVVMRTLLEMGAPSPLEAAVVLEALIARRDRQGRAAYTPEQAMDDAALSERSFRRVTAWLRGQNLVRTTTLKATVDGVDGIHTLYVVNPDRLLSLILEHHPDLNIAGRDGDEPRTPKAKAPDLSDTIGAVMDAYNANRGPLPAAMRTPAREKAIRRVLKDHPTLDVPQAIGIATRVVSTNEFWVRGRYSLDNLLARDNWVKHYEAMQHRAQTSPATTADGTLHLPGLDD